MSKKRKHPHQSSQATAPQVNSREMLRDETGETDTGQGPVKILLVYPNTYGVAMASLGFLETRRRFLALGCCKVERAFIPPCTTSNSIDVRSIESNYPLGAFDIVAFSIAFEMDYLQLLQSLNGASLPLLASRRHDRMPLIVAGGMALSVNSLGLYPFADALVRGRDADCVEQLVRCCLAHPLADGADARARQFESLAAAPSIEVTAGALRATGQEAQFDDLTATDQSDLHRFLSAFDNALETGPIQAEAMLQTEERWQQYLSERNERLARPLSRDAVACQAHTTPPVSTIVTPHAELGRRVLIEIAQGCANRCAFCWLGHHAGCFLPWSTEEILAACDHAAKITGCDSVGLISSAVGAHPEIEQICEQLLERGRRISFSSLRAEEIRPVMLEALVRSGQRGLTLAPEAGDEPLRRRLGKSLDDEGFLRVIDQAQSAGLEDMKLYFMIGLPEETDDEAMKIVDFADRVRRLMLDHGRPRGRLGQLSVNLGIYVPKPGTPFAQRERPVLAAVRKRASRLTRALGALPNVRVATPSAPLADAQTRLSSHGLRAAPFLIQVLGEKGDWRKGVKRMKR